MARKYSLVMLCLLEAQGEACAYCRRPFADLEPSGAHRGPTIDHVVPRSKGGASALRNYLAVCGPCNTRKGDRDPNEFELARLYEVRAVAQSIFSAKRGRTRRQKKVRVATSEQWPVLKRRERKAEQERLRTEKMTEAQSRGWPSIGA